MTPGIKIENLDHLGLIAGVIDELELVKLLDALFPPHRDNQITTGQVVNLYFAGIKTRDNSSCRVDI